MARRRKSTRDGMPPVDRPQQGNRPRVPELPSTIDRIATTVFDADVEATFAGLQPHLSADDTDPMSVRRDLNLVEQRYLDAERAHLKGVAEVDSILTDLNRIEDTIRIDVLRRIQDDQDAGKFPKKKSITEADVRLKFAELYPDEYLEIAEKRRKAEATKAWLKAFRDAWRQRQGTLKSLNDGR